MEQLCSQKISLCCLEVKVGVYHQLLKPLSFSKFPPDGESLQIVDLEKSEVTNEQGKQAISKPQV